MIPDTSSDLSRKYSGTYALLNESPILIDSFIQKMSYISMEYWDLTLKSPFNESSSVHYSTSEVAHILPNLGYINFESTKDVIFLRRVHQVDQEYKFKRGFCQAMCRVQLVNGKALSAITRSHPPLSNTLRERISTSILPFEKVFVDLVKPKFYSFNEAMPMLLSGERLGVALSKKLALVYSVDLEAIVLLRSGWTIGVYIPSSQKIRPLTSLYKQDVIRSNIPLES